MDISLFLAQFLGIYFLVLGVALIVQRKAVVELASWFQENPQAIFIGGVFATLVGALLVAAHNVWDGSFKVIITIIAWVTLLKGVTYTWISPRVFVRHMHLFARPKMLIFSGVVMLVLSVCLLRFGFGLW